MPPRRTCYDKGDFHFVDVHVGARLRARRQLLGITVQQLGACAGVSFQQIEKYETAQNRISPSRLYRFARALDVPVAWFFDGLPLPAFKFVLRKCDVDFSGGKRRCWSKPITGSRPRAGAPFTA